MIRQFDPAVDGEPLAWVLSKNLKRRHLNESQRAMVAAKLANLGEGRPAKTSSIAPVSQEGAAGLLKVSRESVKRAKQVRDKATPELLAAVDQGHLAVSVAAKAATLPAEDQREIAEKAKAGERFIDVAQLYGGKSATVADLG
jgi:hypothetical protein